MADITHTIWKQVYDGHWYQTHDPYLVSARHNAKLICSQLNQLTLPDERAHLLNQLLPNVSRITAGSDFACDYGINIYSSGNLAIGDRVVILDAAPVIFAGDAEIGHGVVIASVTHPLEAARRKAGWQQAKAVEIGCGVKICKNCTILPGSNIPDNAIIPESTVVTPSYCK